MKQPKLAYSQHQSLRMSRSSYKGDVNGIPIRAIDMPGLHARDHSEDTPAEIVAILIHLTNRKADILIYCSPLNQRIDKIDEKIIRTLNKVFSEVIWKNAIDPLHVQEKSVKLRKLSSNGRHVGVQASM